MKFCNLYTLNFIGEKLAIQLNGTAFPIYYFPSYGTSNLKGIFFIQGIHPDRTITIISILASYRKPSLI